MPHEKVVSAPPTEKIEVVWAPGVLSVTVTWPLDGELAAAVTPAAVQPAALFQTVEHRVKRGHMKTYRAARTLLD